jgi:hypothetical protein
MKTIKTGILVTALVVAGLGVGCQTRTVVTGPEFQEPAGATVISRGYYHDDRYRDDHFYRGGRTYDERDGYYDSRGYWHGYHRGRN